MIFRGFILLFAIMLFLVTGCASNISGRDFSFGTVRAFSAGHSTKTDVLKTMGEPWGRFQEKDGIESWLYRYTETQANVGLGSMKSMQRGKSATFLFRGENLTDFYWEESDHRIQGGASGRLISDDEIGALKEEVTTIQEITERFGPPYTRRYRPNGSELWIYVYARDDVSRTVVLDFQNNILKTKGTGGGGDKK